MKIAIFTRQRENLPVTYPWDGGTVETRAGIALCHPFGKERQTDVQTIVIAYRGLGSEDGVYPTVWEADIVAVCRSAPPYETVGGIPRYDIFYANARKLEAAPERSAGPGYIRYLP